MLCLKKCDIVIRESEGFVISDQDTTNRFLRNEIKNGHCLKEQRRCKTCGGETGGALSVAGSRSVENEQSRKKQGAEKHSCAFFSVGMGVVAKNAFPPKMIIVFVEYSLVSTIVEPPHAARNSPCVVVRVITPRVMIAACCTIIGLVQVLVNTAEFENAKNGARLASPKIVWHAPEFLLDSTCIDVDSIALTIDFYCKHALSPYFEERQMYRIETMLHRVGEYILKTVGAKPVIKPFVSEMVTNLDLKSYYVKNPMNKILESLHKYRILVKMHGTVPVATQVQSGVLVALSPLEQFHTFISRYADMPLDNLRRMLTEWTHDYKLRFHKNRMNTVMAKLLRTDVRQEKSLLQLLYAVRCFFHAQQQTFYTRDLKLVHLDTLDDTQLFEIQIRFLFILFQDAIGTHAKYEFSLGNVLLVVSRP